MRHGTFANIAEALSDAGHALLLAMVGAALLADRVVGVVRSPANVAVGVGMLAASALLMLDAFGLLPGRWAHAGWVLLGVSAAAFMGINLF